MPTDNGVGVSGLATAMSCTGLYTSNGGREPVSDARYSPAEILSVMLLNRRCFCYATFLLGSLAFVLLLFPVSDR